jgi:hypothetical protein
MVNAPEMIFSPRRLGKYSKLTKQSPRRHHQANEGKSGLVAGRVRA